MTTSSSNTNGPENVAATQNSAKPLFPRTPTECDLNLDVGERHLAHGQVLGQLSDADSEQVGRPHSDVVAEQCAELGEGVFVGSEADLDGATQGGAAGVLDHECSSMFRWATARCRECSSLRRRTPLRKARRSRAAMPSARSRSRHRPLRAQAPAERAAEAAARRTPAAGCLRLGGVPAALVGEPPGHHHRPASRASTYHSHGRLQSR